jgi:hypothetical protein
MRRHRGLENALRMTSDIGRIRRIAERPSYGALWRRDVLFSHSRSVPTFHISRSA